MKEKFQRDLRETLETIQKKDELLKNIEELEKQLTPGFLVDTSFMIKKSLVNLVLFTVAVGAVMALFKTINQTVWSYSLVDYIFIGILIMLFYWVLMFCKSYSGDIKLTKKAKFEEHNEQVAKRIKETKSLIPPLNISLNNSIVPKKYLTQEAVKSFVFSANFRGAKNLTQVIELYEEEVEKYKGFTNEKKINEETKDLMMQESLEDKGSTVCETVE